MYNFSVIKNVKLKHALHNNNIEHVRNYINSYFRKDYWESMFKSKKLTEYILKSDYVNEKKIAIAKARSEEYGKEYSPEDVSTENIIKTLSISMLKRYGVVKTNISIKRLLNRPMIEVTIYYGDNEEKTYIDVKV